MKAKIEILLSLMFFTGCVSKGKYAQTENDISMLSKKIRTLKLEIKSEQKSTLMIKDSVKYLFERNEQPARGIERRLKAFGITVNIEQSELNEFNFELPSGSEKYYDTKMESYAFGDTFAAEKASYLSTDEKKMYYYLNVARMDPKGFCRKYVIPRLKQRPNSLYLITLVDYMMEMKPKNALRPDKEQYENAKCHSVESGKKGYVGHARQESCKKSFRGECCAYGNSDPLEVVLQLLIDSGVKSLGHRYVCLGWYSYVGISSSKHKTYGTNVVMDFR
ncbi:MAG: CAP domain-containing protein [Flavobacteriales bacterium]|nr:CAP domain-containing protein [Flavobacteriales bacterium]